MTRLSQTLKYPAYLSGSHPPEIRSETPKVLDLGVENRRSVSVPTDRNLNRNLNRKCRILNNAT